MRTGKRVLCGWAGPRVKKGPGANTWALSKRDSLCGLFPCYPTSVQPYVT